MRHFLTLCLVFCFTPAFLLSQTPGPSAPVTLSPAQVAYSPERTDDVAVMFWVCYAHDLDSLLGGTGVLHEEFLFPDSVVVEIGPDQYDRVKSHHIGNILDMKAGDVFGPTHWDYSYTNWCGQYHVDSIGFDYQYARNIADTLVVDTLLVRFYSDSASLNLQEFSIYDTLPARHYGRDSLRYLRQDFDISANRPVGQYAWTRKIPLSAADTTDGSFRTLRFSTRDVPTFCSGMHVDNTPGFAENSGFFGVTFSFIPGYTYSIDDTVNRSGNYLKFASYEENGPDTWPTYFDFTTMCYNPASEVQYNISSIVDTDIRYGNAGSWNGQFRPTYARDSSFALEHHVVHYRLCQFELGREEGQAELLGRMYPNPVEDLLNLHFAVHNYCDVAVEVRNVQGRILRRTEWHDLLPGIYDKHLDMSALPAGFYTVSLSNGTERLTNKVLRR